MKRTVPWVDLAGSLSTALVSARVGAVMNSGRLVGGAEVALLESRVARWMGRKHGVAVSSGTAALELGLTAMGVGPGDEVVVPAVSFVATVGSVLRVGATPVVVDIGEAGPWMDPKAAEDAITGKTRAVIPVHLFGSLAPRLKVGVPVLDDACQSVCPGGPSVGAMTALSFYPTKVLGGLGEGGMVVTDDGNAAERLRRLRTHGMDAEGLVVEIGGTNARLDGVSAAALNARMESMGSEILRRRAIAEAYDAVPGIAPVARTETSPVAVYAIRHPRRDELARSLGEAGVPTRVYYPQPVHEHPAISPRVRVVGSLERAESFCAETLALPCHGGMSADDLEYTVKALERLL